MRTVFITGASTGIGYECAKIFMENDLIDGGNNGSDPADVAEKIYRVAESRKRKMQYVVGKSTEIATLSKILPNKMVRKLIGKTMVR